MRDASAFPIFVMPGLDPGILFGGNEEDCPIKSGNDEVMGRFFFYLSIDFIDDAW